MKDKFKKIVKEIIPYIIILVVEYEYKKGSFRTVKKN